MTISLSLTQQIQQLSSLQNDEDNYLPLTSTLIFVPIKNQIIYHGYQKPKPSEEPKAQSETGNQEAKPKKKFVFKMGKDKEPPKANTDPTQIIQLYQIDSNSWMQLQIKGKLPLPRQNQQTLMLKPSLFLMYGGKSLENDKILNDLHALNLQTLQWKKLFSIEGPPPTENNVIIKLTQTKIALINFKQVWTFEAKDVKWELNTNELPGGVWENLNLKFDNIKQTDKECLLGGLCISSDLASIKVLVLSCESQKGTVRSYLLDLSNKEILKIKMREQIIGGVDNLRQNFGCFEMSLDVIGDEFNQALLTVTNKGKNTFYLTEYDETNNILKVISQAESAIQSQYQNIKVMGKCLDTENSFYFIKYDTQNPKQKLLSKFPTIIRQNLSEVVSQVQKKLINQNSGYINMKNSQIQSIPEESNESSVVGMISYPNQREEEFEQMDNDHFIYQMRRNDKSKMLGSGPSSQVNRSPSALSDQIQSDVEKTDRNNQSLVRKNDQQVEERSSFYNDSNVYVSSRKSPGQQEISNNNSSFPEEQHLQKTLEKILVYEHIKRQNLQEKSRFLQKAIQNSEPLAKLLTKYASTSQKARHIENVKGCKQELETVWNKEVFYRRQMLQDFLPSDSEMLSRNQIKQRGEGRSRELPRGKIDMGKLMRNHLAVEDE